ncbi:MAG TPA: DUF3717 domain-containing protein [Variovorax sp.]|nr:DUF3717 domain-containing protein [Variovorax sp.]
MAAIHITDIEAAVNFWRARAPSPDGVTLAPELRALAEVYALMVYHHEDEVAEQGFPAEAWAAWLAWYETTPDTPCIAICSTSQGDEECKGCGRSFGEVQHWPAMTPAEKRQTWRRITLEDSAWRFNTYAERARETIDAKRAEEAAGMAAEAREAPAEPPSPAIASAASAPGGARGG